MPPRTDAAERGVAKIPTRDELEALLREERDAAAVMDSELTTFLDGAWDRARDRHSAACAARQKALGTLYAAIAAALELIEGEASLPYGDHPMTRRIHKILNDARPRGGGAK